MEITVRKLFFLLLIPTLSWGKSITFSEIGVDIAAINSDISSKVVLSLLHVSKDGKHATLRYTENLNMNIQANSVYTWDSLNGLVEKEYEPFSKVIIENNFSAYTPINPESNTQNKSLIFESNQEKLWLNPSDAPSNFFPQRPYSEITSISINSSFSDSGLLGTISGSHEDTAQGAFIWTKANGYINPTYDIPICNWSSCNLKLITADNINKGIGGSIQSSPLYINIQSNTKVILEKFNYEAGSISALSGDGQYAIVNYSDNNLINTPGIYDIENNNVTLLEPLTIYDWIFGNNTYPTALYDISYDGQLAVGSANNNAIIWTPTMGIKLLSDYISNTYATDLKGWRLTSAKYVSDDGQYIYGEGITSDGLRRIWRLEMNRICETPNW